MLHFPAPRRAAPVAVGAGVESFASALLDTPPGQEAAEEGSGNPAPGAQEQAAPASTSRLPCERYYWVFLLALAPLGFAILDRAESSPKQRLEKTLEANPQLKPRVEEILSSEHETLDDLFHVLPGHRLDDQAFLPRDSKQHLLFAGWSAAGFLALGILIARRAAPAWILPLIALFTATIGIACLALFQDFIGGGFELSLEPERSFLTNLLGFTFIVGLGEELAKALPVLFYVRQMRNPTWRGACLWGLASGVGFGISEGILYSAEQYHGITGPEIYVTRFASCVALHALWTGSVGITIFHSRKLVNKILGMILYERNWHWIELSLPLLQVLGIAMLLHGLYDTFLTQDMIPPALLVALVSFVWMGWQIETSREKEIAALQAAAA
jgi:RsiW-degrading membrane proteinase PrsW (M82 family)